MIQLMEKYDLAKILKEIHEDANYQYPDENQQKDISQQIITEIMINNLKKKQKKDD